MKRLPPSHPVFNIGAALLLVGGSFTLTQANLFQQAVFPASVQASLNAVKSPTLTPTPAPRPIPANVLGVMVNQGQRRTYYLHTPSTATATRPLPLVIALHGSGMQGKEMAEDTALSKLADQEGFIAVYPDGVKQKWNVSGRATEDNVQFVHALIGQMQQIRAIDPQRIYVVGLSNGGILAQKLACQAPEQIAAIATVAASLPTQFSKQCQTKQPVSLLMINGTADSVVPWQGGAAPTVRVGHNLSIPPIPDVVSFWQQHNACPTATKIKSSSDLVDVTDYPSCQANSELMLVTLKGADHVWAGGGYGQSKYGDTTQRVWQFFQRHVLS